MLLSMMGTKRVGSKRSLCSKRRNISSTHQIIFRTKIQYKISSIQSQVTIGLEKLGGTKSALVVGKDPSRCSKKQRRQSKNHTVGCLILILFVLYVFYMCVHLYTLLYTHHFIPDALTVLANVETSTSRAVGATQRRDNMEQAEEQDGVNEDEEAIEETIRPFRNTVSF